MWGELVTTIHGTLEKHDNTVESAHAIIRAIISIVDKDGRVDSLLHTEMQENQGRVAHTLVGKELERQIQDKISFMQKELDIHLEERPPSAFRVSKDPTQRRDWRRWEKEHQDMEVELILKQQELKKRRNIVVSDYSGTLIVRGLESLRLATIDKTVQATASSIPLKALTFSRVQPTPLQEQEDKGVGTG